MSESTRIKLHIPRQDLCEFSHFEPNAEAAVVWLDSLPAANLRRYGEQLHDAVRDLNRLELAAVTRFEVMEALSRGLGTALTSLSRRFLNQPLVLPAEPRQLAQLADQLLVAFSTAYTLAAVHIMRHPDAVPGVSPARTACEALQRAIEFAGRRILQSLQLNQPVPPRTWLNLHQLYALGERQRLAQLPVEDQRRRRVSLQETYLQAALLGCCKANQLRPSDLSGIYRGLLEWSSLVSLRTRADTSNGLFTVDLFGDHPPVYNTGGNLRESQQRCIDTSDLVEQLRTLRDADHACGRSGVRLDQYLTLPSSLLDHLINALGRHSLRNFSRAGGIPTELEIAVGLASVHYHLAGSRHFSTLLPPHLADFHEDPAADPTEGFAIYRATAINASPGGYCMRWPEGVPARLRTGDILCLREPAHAHWVIASVRWVSVLEQAHTLVGVELVSPCATPYCARVIGEHGHASEPRRVLLLPEIQLVGKPHTLLTPRTGFRERQKLVLLGDDDEILIQLQRQVGASAGYSQFDFHYLREVGPGTGVSTETVDIPKARFDSVWFQI